jgi:hypothetical protein
MGDATAYLGQICPKFAASQQPKLFLWFQTYNGEFGSGAGTANGVNARNGTPETVSGNL